MARAPAVVVFDVNVYVDIAGLIPQPFSWLEFDAVLGRVINDPLPHNENAALDSIRAIGMSRSGQVGTGEALEVWTSAPIDDLTITKIHSKMVDTNGVSWTEANAIHMHDEMVNTLVFDMTGGGSVGQIYAPLNEPPLDYEDGCVMRTAAESGDAVESRRFCITRDGPFRDAYEANELEPSVQVMYPSEWVELLRKARRPDLRGLFKR